MCSIFDMTSKMVANHVCSNGSGIQYWSYLIVLENKDSHIVTSLVTDQVLTMVLSGWLSLSLSQVPSILWTTGTDCLICVRLVTWYGICIRYFSYIVIQVLFTHCRQRIDHLHIHQTRRIHRVHSSTIHMPRKRSARHYTNLQITQQQPSFLWSQPPPPCLHNIDKMAYRQHQLTRYRLGNWHDTDNTYHRHTF